MWFDLTMQTLNMYRISQKTWQIKIIQFLTIDVHHACTYLKLFNNLNCGSRTGHDKIAALYSKCDQETIKENET